MRTAARSALATAVLAGALLAPAAGTVFAAGRPAAPVVHGTVGAAPRPADDSRYLGQAVAIGNGIVAVLRNNDKTGPEAWLRYAGLDWTPGDTYMVRVEGLLDSSHPAKRLHGMKTALVKLDSARPELKVTKDGSTKVATYKLPVRNSDLGRGCVSQVSRTNIGAGMFADLTTSPKGPKAVLREWATPTEAYATLHRGRTSLPSSAGIVARILKADTAKPVFEWKTQGGDAPFGRAGFPKLPLGCTPAKG
ncbi:hypothetical protein LG634_27975 [Streptomyces bambusae]|uniref:hypothetical protein n=1 Tax=Streptomyces bambusae TaxID=1550616 RepID=UPI001CFCD5A1|nr:hypothetical protein [Streptomyces bambusae]MCB5168646.1 hypothetical protein [Streptomyces bambusae]